MSFDTSFEKHVVAQALKDVVFLKKAVRTIAPHHFSSRVYSWVWKILSESWRDHKEVPGAQYLVSRVNNSFETPEDRVKYIEALKVLLKANPDNPNIMLDEMVSFVRTAELHKGMEVAISKIEGDAVDEAYETLGTVIKNDHKARDYDCVSWVEGFKQRQSDRIYKREHPEEFVKIPTGIKGLDNIIGGTKPGMLSLILASTGKGKSITLCNIAFTAAKLGYPVVYFSLEMDANHIAQRIDSRWSGMEYSKFEDADFTFEDVQSLEARNEKIYERFKNKLKIVSMSLNKCSISTIREVLDDIHQEDSFSPALVIIDSADHMTAEDRRKDYRLQQAENYTSLKALAMEGYSVVSSVQAGREVADKIAKVENISESFDKARIADLIVSINSPQDESRSTKTSEDYSFLGDEFAGGSEAAINVSGEHLEMFIAKNRWGVSRISIPLDVDFSRMLVRSAEEEGGEY